MTVSHRGSADAARAILKISTSSAAMAFVLAMGAGVAHAQSTKVEDPVASSSTAANPNEAAGTEQTQTDAAPADAGAEDIVVTGFRRSLESAVAEKKNRDQIVESISAEDIGKLPDASIAESIARLPGLTSQRISGRSNSISIRGFAPDFSSTLLNGREQTSTGDNRAVEYDQYPAEVVNQVLVYKTGTASIVGQGLSGTVDLRTIRPIEFGRRVFSIGARGVDADIGKLNADSHQYGYRVNATYVDQFADGMIGVAVAASYVNEPYQTKEFNSWGYGGVGACDARYGTQGAAVTGNDCDPNQERSPAVRYGTIRPAYAAAASGFPIGGSKSYITSSDLKRLGLTGTLEFKPVDNFTSTVDAFYSDFEDNQIKRGIELPLAFDGGSTLQPGYTVTDGIVTAGTFTNVEGVVRNNREDRTAKLYSFGWNNRWTGDDGWNATADVSYSKTSRDEVVLETYAGTGYNRGVGATDTLGFTTGPKGTTFTHGLDYSNPSLILLTDPLGWGGSNVQAGYYNNRHVDDRIWQYRAEVEKELEGSFLSSIQAGVNYTNHDKSLTPNEAIIQLAGGAVQTAIPAQYLKKPSDQAYLGLGPIVSYDPFELLNGGVYTLLSNNNNNDVRAKAYSIHEDLMTMYLQANIKQDIGSSQLTGNFGVQAINTSQHTDGYYIDPNNSGLVAIRQGADYWDVMPSANLSFRTPSDIVVRAAAARQVMRPRMDSMRLGLSYGVDQARGLISGSSGNPYLRPFRANSADVTVEKYFGTKGYLAVQGFYKKLINYVIDRNIPETPYDYTGLPLSGGFQTTNPGAANYVSPAGVITTPFDLKGGELYGVELAGTLPLGEIVGLLDGFGVTGGGSYTKSKIEIPGQSSTDLPGYSRWVANGTAYFEKWGFSARGSVRYRSTFIGELSGFGANRTNRRAAPETIIDGQIGYDFAGSGLFQGLSLYIQGQNLTNEPFVTIDPPSGQVIDYQRYGRRFLAGATLKF